MTIDILWVLFCSVLVLIMQGGFLFLESGLTRKKNAINVALKNAADFALTFLIWWLISFGIMFGASYQGVVGTDSFMFEVSRQNPFNATFFIFQAMFCATAATIISGAIAERTKYLGYKLITLVVVSLIYPVFGHWTWGGLNETRPGYLAESGFVDFAGSTVVHSVGGWVALAAIIIIGPRLGRFTSNKPSSIPFSNLPSAMLGVVLFIVGWVGFNAGSTLAFTADIPLIIINTLLAACAGGMGAYLINLVKPSAYLEKSIVMLNGILAGLVAITASCHAVNQLEAILIGFIGSLAMLSGSALLAKFKLDDAISAIPVHLCAGIWGTLAVALFGDLSILGTGLTRGEQFIAQFEGILTCALWSFTVAFLLLSLINRFYPLRVSGQDEQTGLNIAEHNAKTDLHDFLVNIKKQETDLSHRVPVEPYTEVGLIADRYNQLMDVIEQTSAKTQSIVRDIQAGVVTLDGAHKIVGMNPAAEAIFSIKESNAIGYKISDIFSIALVTELTNGNEIPFIGDCGQIFNKPGHLRLQGSPYQHHTTKYLDIVITQSSHAVIELTCLINDMTEYKAIETALHAEKEQMHKTLDSIGDGVITTTASGNIVYMNPIAESLIGWPLEKAKNKKIYQVFAVVDSPDQRPGDSIIRSVVEHKQTHVTNKPRLLYCRDGSVRAIRHTIAPMMDLEENVTGTVVVFQDVTQAQVIQRQLTHQARHDGLTGLINRNEFDNQLSDLVDNNLRADESHVLLYIDLDRFKIVNDLCGHQAGDELLRQVARQMKQKIRNTDLMARLGGDEFAAILYQCSLEKGKKVAESIRDRIESFRFSWDGKEFSVTTSIGVIPIDQFTSSVQDVIQLADAACYASKDLGRNNVYLYQPDDKEINARKSQVKWVSCINNALEADRFKLYFQRIAPVDSQDTGLKFEVLIRLEKDGQVYMPGAFIPTAERYNLMHSIDKWVIKNTFKWLAEHKDELPQQTTCAINLSGESVNKPELKSFIMAMLDEYQIDGGKIVFEITETIAIANLQKASDVMQQLRKVGIRFALDDFGSGLSSFGYLKNLPIDYLKIDGAFVKEINTNKFDQAMVEAINNIGHTMQLKTIVEYVSNAEIKTTLESIQVDYLQGFYIHKPSPIDNLLTPTASASIQLVS